MVNIVFPGNYRVYVPDYLDQRLAELNASPDKLVALEGVYSRMRRSCQEDVALGGDIGVAYIRALREYAANPSQIENVIFWREFSEVGGYEEFWNARSEEEIAALRFVGDPTQYSPFVVEVGEYLVFVVKDMAHRVKIVHRVTEKVVYQGKDHFTSVIGLGNYLNARRGYYWTKTGVVKK